MSVLLKGMEMPEGWEPHDCDRCPFFEDAVLYTFCKAKRLTNTVSKNICPIEVRTSERIKFVLNGCDICFVAEAPKDITLEQLLVQSDKIEPDWCACGVCSCERAGYKKSPDAEIFFDYDAVAKANDDVPCSIFENPFLCPVCGAMNKKDETNHCPICGAKINMEDLT